MSARARLAPLLSLMAVIGVGAASVATLHAYLPLGTQVNNVSVLTRWTSMPIRFGVTDRDDDDVSAAQLRTAAEASFATWAAVPSAALSASFAGFTSADPTRSDGQTVIGFEDHPELDRTLGVTSFTLDRTTGTLLEADIYLNSAFDWSVAPAGETAHFDVQSVLTHEVGHLLGLGHSLLGETVPRAEGGRRVVAKRAVMFPIAYAVGTTLDRTLRDDDIAGISAAYPTGAFLNGTGSIAGRVTRGGAGIFGAHVIATNTKTGQTVAGFSLDDRGQFTIGGLTPGLYVLRVEPIDDADVGSFFSDEARVDTNFRATFHTKLVAVPTGGSGDQVLISVAAK
jgi:hypothetical protein